MIQIRLRGTQARSSKQQIKSHRHKYQRLSSAKIPGFFHPELIRFVRARLSEKDFFNRSDKGIAFESCMRKNDLFCFMHFMLNDEKVFAAVEELTGCSKIQSFVGRLYRMVPGQKHYDSWHNDVDGKRLVGLSINLGKPFKGGYLEIRDEKRQALKHRVSNRKAGDAVLFEISPQLKHRVTRTLGKNPRVVFAGWFQRKPRFASLLK